MATINDLGKSISDMTEEELFERLRDLRQSRRTRKPSKKASSYKKKEIDLNKVVGSMTPEARLRLAEMLERG